MKSKTVAIMPFLPFSCIFLVPYFWNMIKTNIIESIEEEEMQEEFDEEDDNFIKVAIVEDKAYWIIENTLYQANVVDGDIIKEEAEPVDAFDMDFRDVNKLMNILDNIQDWKN
jgi:hypothetical protein